MRTAEHPTLATLKPLRSSGIASAHEEIERTTNNISNLVELHGLKTANDGDDCGSDAVFVRVAEESIDAILIVGGSGRIEYVNPHFIRLVGFDSSELIGMNLAAALPADGRVPSLFEAQRAATLNGADWRGAVQIRRKNGEPLLALAAVHLVRGGGGEIAQHLIVIQSLASQRATEVALKVTEDRLDGMLREHPAGYAVVNRVGVITRVNPTWLRLHACTNREEAIGQRFIETIAPEGRDRMDAEIKAVLSGKPSASGEYVRLERSGRLGYNRYSFRAVREPEGGSAIECFLIDTSRQHTFEQRYEMLFSRMLDGFALFQGVQNGAELELQIVDMNLAFENLMRVKRSDVIGCSLKACLPNLEQSWCSALKQVRNTNEPCRFCVPSDDGKSTFEVTLFSPRAGEFVCLVEDITEKVQLEEQFRQAQKMEIVGQLAGGMAHDFNNLLTGISLHLEMLLDSPDLSALAKESLRELLSHAHRTAGANRQLLGFSRGGSAPRQQLIDVNQTVVDLLKMVRRLLGEQIEIKFHPATEPATITGEEGMLHQVFLNLCLNARDAMPGGGTLELRVETICRERLGTDFDHVAIVIADTGSGMTEETLQSLFEPFFTTKEPGKGTGLGLSTARRIVQEHGGWISVESTLGQGSAFTVSLPAASKGGVRTRVSSLDGGCRGDGMTVMIIEDDDIVRRLLVMALEKKGFTVLHAKNGTEAVDIWGENRQRIKMVVSDMVLPGRFSGRDLAAAFRCDQPDIPIIITTGYGTVAAETTIDSIPGPPIAVIAKPYSTHDLVRLIAAKTQIASPESALPMGNAPTNCCRVA